jgi:hypothetical protein
MIGLRLKQGQIPPFEKGRREGILLIKNMKRFGKTFLGER